MQCIQLLFWLGLLLLFSCGGGEHGFNDGGGSTETIGMLFTEDGTPAVGAAVVAIPARFQPGETAIDHDSLTTDAAGAFPLGSLSDGVYNLHYHCAGTRALRRNVSVLGGVAEENVSDTLRLPGGVAGVVALRPEHNSGAVYLLLMGSERFTTPLDSSGRFLFGALAPGHYALRIITTEGDYTPFDTTVQVLSGSVDTLSDTLRPVYNGLPQPGLLTASYEPALLRSELRWSGSDSPRFYGYEISRAVAGSHSFKVVASGLRDTLFQDSVEEGGVAEGGTYEYRVAAVDRDGITGAATTPVAVLYHSLFARADSLVLSALNSSGHGGVVEDGAGTLFAICSERALLYEVDAASLSLRAAHSLPEAGKPLAIELMDDGSLMIATDRGVYNVSRRGERLWRYSIKSCDIATSASRYLYYTERREFYTPVDVLLRLDTYTGFTDTVANTEGEQILAFAVTGDELWLVLQSEWGAYIARSPLERYDPLPLYRCGRVLVRARLSLTADGILFMAGGELRWFDRDSMRLRSRTQCRDAVALSAFGEAVVIQRKSGMLQQLKPRTVPISIHKNGE